jgi:hypothetical protein
MDMTTRTWNVRSLYRAGSLKTVASESVKYNLDLVAAKVRWDNSGSQTADNNTLSIKMGNIIT